MILTEMIQALVLEVEGEANMIPMIQDLVLEAEREANMIRMEMIQDLDLEAEREANMIPMEMIQDQVAEKEVNLIPDQVVVLCHLRRSLKEIQRTATFMGQILIH